MIELEGAKRLSDDLANDLRGGRVKALRRQRGEVDADRLSLLYTRETKPRQLDMGEPSENSLTSRHPRRVNFLITQSV